MALRLAHPSLLGYDPGFLPEAEHDELLLYLASVPIVDFEARDVRATFAFVTPRAGATVVEGRWEAAAGSPVWTGAGPVRAVAIPDPLAALAARVDHRLAAEGALWSEAATAPQPFTSVYVDRYPPGGSFFPHTDRDCYGSVVAGVSIGAGSCRIAFETERATDASQVLEPGSLYVFSGRLRAAPCEHRIADVSDVRYGISLRFAASGTSDEGAG